MATKNAIGTNIPIEVAGGGSGAASLTDHSPLIGSGTSAISDVVVGTTGLLFIGSTGADPFFDDSSTGDFTFTSSTASQTRVFTVSNTDNTGAATSAARIDITVGGANVADPQVKYLVTGATTWSSGIDNSDSDKLKISADAALETTNVLSITTAGDNIKPLQPAFGAVAADQANVTGDGTVYTVLFTGSEYFDQNGDFDGATGIFTAPVTGKFQFNLQITSSGITTQSTMQTRLVTSNHTFIPGIATPQAIKDSSNRLTRTITFVVDMDAADTANCATWMTGATKVVDILGASTFFNGMLVC